MICDTDHLIFSDALSLASMMIKTIRNMLCTIIYKIMLNINSYISILINQLLMLHRCHDIVKLA